MTTSRHELRYSTPARFWTDGLPLGNGHLGAMVHHDPGHDRWQINDDTCWSGWPGSSSGVPASDEPSPEVIERVRTALLAGDVETAEREVRKVQYGHSQAYQPLAELEVITGSGDSDAVLDQRRLDLATAIADWSATSPTVGGSGGEVIVSAPAQAIIGRYVFEQPTAVTLRLVSPHAGFGAASLRRDGDQLVMISRMPSDVHPKHDDLTDAISYDPTPGHALTAVTVVQVVTDGTITGPGDHDDQDLLMITGARELIIVITTETDFTDPSTAPHGDVAVLVAAARGRAADVAARPYDQLRGEHVVEHRSWFDRFDLELGSAQVETDATADTDALLARASAGDLAPQLVALMVAYGRYLMIASSRPGSRAINLQGIWNPWVQPPWSSNYTVNINTEMNYWPALTANLAECAEPLYSLVETMALTGAETARRVYDRPGWAAHHNADVWGFTLPVGPGNANPCWAAWPMAGFWLLRHFAEHHRFTGDEAFWTERAWPLIDGAVAFGLATLVELPGGELGTVPSTSPENSYLTEDGTRAAVTVSATMDLALLRDVFALWTDAAESVRRRGGEVDPDRAAAVADALPRLPLPAPTERGTYPEWRDDLTEGEPTHRHQSHLYDVFPGDAVTTEDPTHAPLLAAAAETLRRRGAYSTGWSLAWRIALHARLRDRDAALISLGFFLSPVPDEIAAAGPQMAQAGGVYRNLFCAHPPFQIDGNFGATAGVIEMLLQSHARSGDVPIVELLPCLPATWPHGRLTGVRARGGLTVDLAWTDGIVTSVAIRADHDQPAVLRFPGRADLELSLVADQTWTLD